MRSTGEYSLIGCTVAPGFDYTDFELAPKLIGNQQILI